MSARIPTLLAMALLSALSAGFTVKRNVNAAEPPVDAIVLFDKNASHSHLELLPNGVNCTAEFTESGDIEIRFTRNTEANPEIRWTPGDGLPKTFDANDYQYLILRCQFSGTQTRTFDNGRQVEQEVDNPWMITTLLDTEGVPTSSLNIASLTGTDAVPREMVTLKIPMSLFLQTAYNNPTQIEAVAFKIGKTHDYNDRNYTLTIERIALAN